MSKKGFSLVSVMIAMGLSAVLIYGVMSLMDQSSKAVKNAKLGTDAIDFQLLLEDVFKSQKACTATFGQLAPGSISGYTARDTGGYKPSDTANLLADGTGILNSAYAELWKLNSEVMGGFILKEMKIKQNVLDPNNPSVSINNLRAIDPSKNIGFLEVQITLDKPGDKNLGGENKLVSFYLTAHFKDLVGGDFRILKCQLSGSNDGLLTWEDVVFDNADFDPNCSYRFMLTGGTYVSASFQSYGLDPTGGWFYSNMTAPKTIIYTSHLAAISYISAQDKTRYQVLQDNNGILPADYHNPNAYTVVKLQKRCE
jgi:type II secretory pathway pseudopilin PulG